MKAELAYFDTNVLVYAFTPNDARSVVARQLIAQGGIIGVQTMNEFVSVSTRKLRIPISEIRISLRAIRGVFPPPVPLTETLHEDGMRIAERYGYHIYDSLMIAAALQAGCRILYSEDMRSGQIIEGLMIVNPFLLADGH